MACCSFWYLTINDYKCSYTNIAVYQLINVVATSPRTLTYSELLFLQSFFPSLISLSGQREGRNEAFTPVNNSSHLFSALHTPFELRESAAHHQDIPIERQQQGNRYRDLFSSRHPPCLALIAAHGQSMDEAAARRLFGAAILEVEAPVHNPHVSPPKETKCKPDKREET
jgi:hypothetical protein